MENGIFKIEANSGTQVKTTINPAMLPKYILAIKPQTKSGFSTKSNGPAEDPKSINRPEVPQQLANLGYPKTKELSNNCLDRLRPNSILNRSWSSRLF